MYTNKKLLLVEDDIITAAAEASMLKKNGFDVVTAPTGEKAIQLFNSQNFDLILMDIDLGHGLTGSETAELILQQNMIPIVFLTSHSEKETVEKVRSITRYGYVIKNSGDFVLLSSIEMAFELFNSFLKINDSERKYRNLYHYGHVGLFETSLKDATIVACNQRYCDMAGLNSVDEAIGQDVLHLYDSPEDREEVKRIMREHGYISDHILKLKNQKTGKTFWAEFSARLNTELDIAEGTIIDITNLKTAEENLKIKNEKLLILNEEKEAANEELQAAIEEMEATNEELISANDSLTQNQINLKQAESELRESQDRYRQLFEAESDAIFLIENEHGCIIEANNAAAVLYGYSRDELLVMKNTDLSAESEETQKVTHGTPVISENVVTIPLRYHKKKDGTVFPVEITGRFFKWRDKPVHIAAIRDITERKINGDKIQSLLDEKELLLREVHHRIKNNMNIISNLLFLQSEMLKDQSAIDALADARSRVQSMMLIYDKLYRSSDYKSISVKDYLNNLIDEIASVFPSAGKIVIEKHVEDFSIDSNMLYNLGIIVNELITNSFKYAFTDGRNGIIKISVLKTDNTNGQISVSDNGVGFTDSNQFIESRGFGLELIKILSGQLKADMELTGKNGTLFKMKFPL
jgi:PAS domain S-box-containing protein